MKMLEFIFDYRNRKKVDLLEKRVVELEAAVIATIKLLQMHTQSFSSLTSEVVKISNVINSEIEKHEISTKDISSDYLN